MGKARNKRRKSLTFKDIQPKERVLMFRCGTDRAKLFDQALKESSINYESSTP